MGKIIDITGKIYGRLTVISYSHQISYRHYWACRCECGSVKAVNVAKLNSGNTKSCGCYKYDLARQRRASNGESRKTKEYNSWASMKYRCTNSKAKCYIHYGGRGITVCDRWMNSYVNFLADMGRAPGKSYTIERDNVNRNYEPGNCRWATMVEQANNKTNSKRIEYKGKSQTLREWSIELGIDYELLRSRIGHGFSVEKMFTLPHRFLAKRFKV